MRVVIALLLLIFCALQARLWHGAGSVAELRGLRELSAQQQAENDRLRERNEEMKNEVRDLASGTDAVEERARHELGLIKPGETFYRIVDKDE